MTERKDVYTWKGNAVTLVGNPVKVGDKAPAATLTAGDLSDAPLSKWDGKIKVLNVVASLDTPVCDAQTKKFNDAVTKLGDKVALITISMDLPFAQKRWCAAADAPNAITLSDFRHKNFGEQWGLYVKEKGLLARGVFVIDTKNVVKYAAITKDLVDEPAYEPVLAVVKGLL